MADNIFISYRRSDDASSAGWLYDLFQKTKLKDRIFMDVDSIPIGEDFVKVLEDQIKQCEVVIALIGKSWIDARDKSGNRRLDDPNDFVRIEISTAIQQDKRVIPVLVNNAEMPNADELPEPLKSFSRLNAVQLRYEHFAGDVQRLAIAIISILDESAIEKRRSTDEKRRSTDKTGSNLLFRKVLSVLNFVSIFKSKSIFDYFPVVTAIIMLSLIFIYVPTFRDLLIVDHNEVPLPFFEGGFKSVFRRVFVLSVPIILSIYPHILIFRFFSLDNNSIKTITGIIVFTLIFTIMLFLFTEILIMSGIFAK